MVQFKPVKPLLYPLSSAVGLPTEQDLPDTDNRPVDNELQLLLPWFLRAVLKLAWANRTDWFLGANLGVYYDPDRPAVGPDAFLSLGVPLYRPGQDLRLSYLLWQEGVVPQWVLEIVSKTPGGEYEAKMKLYAQLGVSYYTVFNPKPRRRGNHDPFEVYKLIGDEYVRQPGDWIWMPELGLGLGIDAGIYAGLPGRKWLYWYDEQGNRYPAPENVIETAQQEAMASRQREAEAVQQAVEAQRREAEAVQQAVDAQRRQDNAVQQAIEAQRRQDNAVQQAMEAQRRQDEAIQQLEAFKQKLRSRGIDPDTL